MAKKKKTDIPEILSKEQQDQLQKMVSDMMDIASDVLDEYNDVVENDESLGVDIDFSDLTNLSGSLTQIHQDSPFLDEMLKGDSWKRVIKNIPTVPKPTKEDDDTE